MACVIIKCCKRSKLAASIGGLQPGPHLCRIIGGCGRSELGSVCVIAAAAAQHVRGVEIPVALPAAADIDRIMPCQQELAHSIVTALADLKGGNTVGSRLGTRGALGILAIAWACRR